MQNKSYCVRQSCSDLQQNGEISLGNLLTNELELARAKAEASNRQKSQDYDVAAALASGSQAQQQSARSTEGGSHRLRRLLQKRLLVQKQRDSQKQRINALKQQLTLQAAQMEQLEQQLAESEAQNEMLESIVYVMNASGTASPLPEQQLHADEQTALAASNSGSAGSPCISRFPASSRPESADSPVANAITDSPTVVDSCAAQQQEQFMQLLAGTPAADKSSMGAAAAAPGSRPMAGSELLQLGPGNTAAGPRSSGANTAAGPRSSGAALKDSGHAPGTADAVLQLLLTTQKDQLKKAIVKALDHQQQQQQQQKKQQQQLLHQSLSVTAAGPGSTVSLQQQQQRQLPGADSAVAPHMALQHLHKRQKLVMPQDQQQWDFALYDSVTAADAAALHPAAAAALGTPFASSSAAAAAAADGCAFLSGGSIVCMPRSNSTPPAAAAAAAATAPQPIAQHANSLAAVASDQPVNLMNGFSNMLLSSDALAAGAWGKAPVPERVQQQQQQGLLLRPAFNSSSRLRVAVSQPSAMMRAGSAPPAMEYNVQMLSALNFAQQQQQQQFMHSGAGAAAGLLPAAAADPAAAAAQQQQQAAPPACGMEGGSSSICSSNEVPCGAAAGQPGAMGDVPGLDLLDQLPGNNTDYLLDAWMGPCTAW